MEAEPSQTGLNEEGNVFFSTINIVKAAADFIHQCKYALVKKTKLTIRATRVLLYQVNTK